MTKSLIDIINKCKGKYERFSKQDVFGFEQIVKLTTLDIQHHIAIRESHKGKHKGIYNPFGVEKDDVKSRMVKSMRLAKYGWQGQPDLNCDDPLYDGNQVY